jgi:aminoglycoside phosphotransferase family enzyme
MAPTLATTQASQPNRINKEIAMNKIIATMITLSLAALAAQSALAEPGSARDPRVNRHQFKQHERIEQGVRSGELTRGETRQLAAEQRAIRQEERRYKSDGVMTRDERKDLHQDLNAASRNIYNEKHDAETR